MLDDLTRWRLARRQPDPADGRRNIVRITSGGRKRLEELDAVVAGVQRAVLQPLSRAERRTLLHLLGKLG